MNCRRDIKEKNRKIWKGVSGSGRIQKQVISSYSLVEKKRRDERTGPLSKKTVLKGEKGTGNCRQKRQGACKQIKL